MESVRPPRTFRAPFFQSLLDFLRKRFRKSFFQRLKVEHSVVVLSGLFVAGILVILVYSVKIINDQKTNAVLIGIAEQQRVMIEKYRGDIWLAGLGHPVKADQSRRTIAETIALLIGGAPAVLAPEHDEWVQIPPAPDSIRHKLAEQQTLLNGMAAAAEAYLSLTPNDPGRADHRDQLDRQAKLLEVSAADAVDLYKMHSRHIWSTVFKWELALSVNLILLAIVLGVQIRKDNRRLVEEIQERKRVVWQLRLAEDQLRQARDNLENKVQIRTDELFKSNRDLETLLYVISHDLKEPLRSIENFSTLLVERYGASLDEKATSYLGHMSNGVERLHRLLDDVLMLSRAQRVGDQISEIAGEEIVRDALRRVEDKVQTTGASIVVEPGLPVFRVEKIWVVEALYNLISNALKFTRDGEPPDIEIGVFRSDGAPSGYAEIGFVVRDRGPGVPPEMADRIFQLFQRGVSRSVEGTGAGLAIVRQVAAGHDGRAWVQPRVDGGSEFFVTFCFVSGSEEA